MDGGDSPAPSQEGQGWNVGCLHSRILLTASTPTFFSKLFFCVQANVIDLVQMGQNGLGLPLPTIPFSSYSPVVLNLS